MFLLKLILLPNHDYFEPSAEISVTKTFDSH